MIGRLQTILCLAAVLPAVCAGAARAQGCGPTRLKVTESVSIDAPPAKVWAVIGNFQDMSWDTEAISASGSGGNQPDVAVRTVTMRDGGRLTESLYKYDSEAMSYAYHLDASDLAKLPVQNASLTLEVAPGATPKTSTVRWRAAFYRVLKAGEGSPDAADQGAAQAMRAFLKSGLSHLVGKVDARS